MVATERLALTLAVAAGTVLAATLLLSVKARAVAAPLAPDAVSAVEYASGLQSPVDVANTGVPGDERLFVVERAGRIMIVLPGGVLSTTPFLDINSLVIDGGGEQGLLGLAFSPNYVSDGRFYVYYNNNGGNINLARYMVSANPNVASITATIILTITHNTATNHNGGDLAFGPDGYLYIAPGDGGNTPENGQALNTLLGKVLRINVTGVPTYTIPASNPYTATVGRDEIWALGLRNPFRFSFDRQTGDFYIADVGENAWEEVNFRAAGSPGGANYGWACYEGVHPHPPATGCGPSTDYLMPVAEYCNTDASCTTGGQAVIGGFVYRGGDAPGLVGNYLYADSYSNRFWAMQSSPPWTVTLLSIANVPNPASFGEDVNGELYVAALGNGRIYCFRDNPSAVATFTLQTPYYLPIVAVPPTAC